MLNTVTIRTYLACARREIAEYCYSSRYFAMADGEPCSPTHPELDTLSLRGAIIRVTPTASIKTEILNWLDDRFLLPYVDPKTKEAALQLLDRAIQQATPRKVHAA